MMYHVIIKEERRADPARQAVEVSEQLHAQGSAIKDIDNPNLLYVAEWDGQGPLVVLKGDDAMVQMRWAGWPVPSPAQMNSTKENQDG